MYFGCNFVQQHNMDKARFIKKNIYEAYLDILLILFQKIPVKGEPQTAEVG